MGRACLLLVLAGCRINFDPSATADASPEDVPGAICTPTGDEATSQPGTCEDGVDNDCDGAIDHEDAACPRMRYRSVGTSTLTLGPEGTQVEIAGATARFTQPVPDHVGVGDVLAVNTNAGSFVAFIRERITSTEFRVQAADGGSPPSAPAGSQVDVFRAYTSIAGWAALDENDALPVALQDFDTSRDLVGADTALSVALYADGVDQGNVIVSGWQTSPDHYLRLFTPVTAREVGASQRHRGVIGPGYRLEALTNAAALQLLQSHVRIHGVSFRSFLNASLVSALDVIATAPNIDVRVSHNIADGNGSNGSDGVLHMEANGASAAGRFLVSNNLVYGAPTGTSECMWHRDIDGAAAEFYIYNNTVWDCARGIEARDTAGRAVAINNVAFATTLAFYEYNGRGEFGAATTNNVSSDGSAAAIGLPAVTNAVASELFVAATAGSADLHLRPDAPIAGLGIDLRGDPVLPIVDDVEGDARPTGAVDPGADQR